MKPFWSVSALLPARIVYDEVVNFIQTGFQMEIAGSNETLETLEHLLGDHPLHGVLLKLGGLREEEDLNPNLLLLYI